MVIASAAAKSIGSPEPWPATPAPTGRSGAAVVGPVGARGRGALVLPQPVPGRWTAREDGDDGHVLAQLAQARDEAAARERRVVRVRGDEDVGHRAGG